MAAAPITKVEGVVTNLNIPPWSPSPGLFFHRRLCSRSAPTETRHSSILRAVAAVAKVHNIDGYVPIGPADRQCDGHVLCSLSDIGGSKLASTLFRKPSKRPRRQLGNCFETLTSVLGFLGKIQHSLSRLITHFGVKYCDIEIPMHLLVSIARGLSVCKECICSARRRYADRAQIIL